MRFVFSSLLSVLCILHHQFPEEIKFFANVETYLASPKGLDFPIMPFYLHISNTFRFQFTTIDKCATCSITFFETIKPFPFQANWIEQTFFETIKTITLMSHANFTFFFGISCIIYIGNVMALLKFYKVAFHLLALILDVPLSK